MADVFLSFIHEEKDYAEIVQAFITQILEIRPFMSSDKLQVYAGEKWLDRIMDELKEAKVIILMLSEESVKRPWVNFEAGAGWATDKKIIPVCFGGLRKEDLPKPYSGLQAVDLQNSGDTEYLARSIAHYLGIEEPMNLKYMGAAALGGKEAMKKAEKELAAYNEFMSKLMVLLKRRISS